MEDFSRLSDNDLVEKLINTSMQYAFTFGKPNLCAARENLEQAKQAALRRLYSASTLRSREEIIKAINNDKAELERIESRKKTLIAEAERMSCPISEDQVRRLDLLRATTGTAIDQLRWVIKDI